jgi:hypothetical protein
MLARKRVYSEAFRMGDHIATPLVGKRRTNAAVEGISPAVPSPLPFTSPSLALPRMKRVATGTVTPLDAGLLRTQARSVSAIRVVLEVAA